MQLSAVFGGEKPMPTARERSMEKASKLLEKQRYEASQTSGEGGIRTPGTREGTPVFKTGALGHSATSPQATKPYF